MKLISNRFIGRLTEPTGLKYVDRYPFWAVEKVYPHGHGKKIIYTIYEQNMIGAWRRTGATVQRWL